MILKSSKTEMVVCSANVVFPLKYVPNLLQNYEGVKYIVPFGIVKVPMKKRVRWVLTPEELE
jgi:hypothetical protein